MSTASTVIVEEFDTEPLDDVEVTPEYSLLARLGAEVFGTFTLVLIGVGIALFASINSVAGSGLAVPLGFGIAVLGAASAVGHISGGHFNPAVSLGAAIGGRISWADLVPYWVAQIFGGAAAAAILYLLVPSTLPGLITQDGTGTVRTFFSGTSNGFGEHSPLGSASTGAVSFSLTHALIIEVVTTAIFVGVILGVTDKRSKISYAPAAIGLTLAVLIALAAPITNASLNPARSTATAIFSEGWALNQLWLFWAAPLLGAAIAGLVYLLVTPTPETAGEWPEVEPTAEAEAELEAQESDIDAIDALLARKDSAAATLPELEADVEADVEATIETAVEAGNDDIDGDTRPRV